MYATAAARPDGLLLLCGGRDADSTPMGDAYGLARHRDGRWEWAAAPGTTKLGLGFDGTASTQHKTAFTACRCLEDSPACLPWSSFL